MPCEAPARMEGGRWCAHTHLLVEGGRWCAYTLTCWWAPSRLRLRRQSIAPLLKDPRILRVNWQHRDPVQTRPLHSSHAPVSLGLPCSVDFKIFLSETFLDFLTPGRNAPAVSSRASDSCWRAAIFATVEKCAVPGLICT